MTDSTDYAAHWRPAPLLPRRDGRDGALAFVVAALSLLACLAAVTALASNRAAAGWTAALSGAATVQVRPSPGESAAYSAARAAEALAAVPGVAEASAMEPEQARALLEPWFGRDGVSPDWPIPQLVTVTFEPGREVSSTDMAAALRQARVDALVDDHRRWRGDVERAGAFARAAATAVALLMALATGAVIAFATRSGLEARRNIVEVLHLAGAKDAFIAQLFQGRFASLAGVAGLTGALAAALLVALARLLGGGEGFTPALPFAWPDLLILVPVPLLAALIAAVSARLTAQRLLGRAA